MRNQLITRMDYVIRNKHSSVICLTDWWSRMWSRRRGYCLFHAPRVRARCLMFRNNTQKVYPVCYFSPCYSRCCCCCYCCYCYHGYDKDKLNTTTANTNDDDDDDGWCAYGLLYFSSSSEQQWTAAMTTTTAAASVMHTKQHYRRRLLSIQPSFNNNSRRINQY